MNQDQINNIEQAQQAGQALGDAMAFGTLTFLAVSFIVGIIMIIASVKIAGSKGRSRLGWGILTLFTGIIGLVIVACMSKTDDKEIEDQMKMKAKMKAMGLDE